MKQQEKKWDYYVRAIHVVEIPLREAEYKERAAKDRQLWEEHEAERVQRDEEDHLAKVCGLGWAGARMIRRPSGLGLGGPTQGRVRPVSQPQGPSFCSF